ncbi:MAG: helix-turn-helix domain-containing protein [Actinomycetota bacterium]|nr:helix-turn-helix domain-containing protein [Actinomycetota bacterium]
MSAVNCSIEATIRTVGDRWTLLILRNIFRGIKRFENIQKDLGIARNLLSKRLQHLVENEVIERFLYQEKPNRYEYRLTSKGRALSPSLIALMQWGDQWCSSDEPPIMLVHENCGSPLTHSVQCGNCDRDVKPGEIKSLPKSNFSKSAKEGLNVN